MLVEIGYGSLKVPYTFLLAAYGDLPCKEHLRLQTHFRKEFADHWNVGAKERICIDQPATQFHHRLNYGFREF